MIILRNFTLIIGILIYILIAKILKIFFLFISPNFYFKIISLWTMIFSRFLRFVFRVKVIIEGDRFSLRESGIFIVSNHISYLDGIVLASLLPVVFVSKSEVMHWPLFGWMTEAGETIFIDRKRKHKSLDYIQETTQMLKKRVNVLLFPEGTSTNGEKLLSFQSVHFQSPLNAKSSILPITITYTRIGEENMGIGNRDKICWYGQIQFFWHLRNLIKLNEIEAKVVIHPKIGTDTFIKSNYTRKDLSEALYKIISEDYPLFK